MVIAVAASRPRNRPAARLSSGRSECRLALLFRRPPPPSRLVISGFGISIRPLHPTRAPFLPSSSLPCHAVDRTGNHPRKLHRDAPLVQVAPTDRRVRCLKLRPAECRQEQGREHCEDSDDDQEFDERKSRAPLVSSPRRPERGTIAKSGRQPRLGHALQAPRPADD